MPPFESSRDAGAHPERARLLWKLCVINSFIKNKMIKRLILSLDPSIP